VAHIIKTKFMVWGIIAVVLALLPLFVQDDYWRNFLFLAFLYVTVSQSFNIMTGYTGQVLMGQSSFFGMGALVTRLLWESGLSIFAAILAGALATVVLACIIGLPTLKLKGAYFAIGTLGMAIALRITVGNVLSGVSFLPAEALATYSLLPRYYFAFVLAGLTILAVYVLANSRPGLALVAIREDEDAAASSGIYTFKYKVMSLFIATFIAGLAGGVYAYYGASYYYYVPFNLSWSLEPLMIGFIGGVGTIIGPTIAAVAFVSLKELFARTAGEFSVLIFGILFILVVMFLPGGLVELGGKVRRLIARFTTSQQKT